MKSIFRILSVLTVAASISFLLSCDGDGVSPLPPTVLSVSPEDNLENVSVNTSISVTFSQAMNIPSAEGAFSMNPNVTGTFSWGSGNTVMTFTPSSDLPVAIQQYTCTVSKTAQDSSGNELSSQYQWRWTTWSNDMKSLITDSNYDHAYSVTTDPSGNTYLTGIFYAIADFGVYFGTTDPKTSMGSSDTFVTKINADGTYAWTKRIGGEGADTSRFITADLSGNVYHAGTFVGAVDIGNDFGISDVINSSGTSASIVTKINADGTYAWAKQDCNLNSLLGTSMLNWSDYRHIYNYTDYWWTFTVDAWTGNVYFLDCPNGTEKNGPCTLSAQSTIKYKFTRTGGRTEGSVDMFTEDAYDGHRGLGGMHYVNDAQQSEGGYECNVGWHCSMELGHHGEYVKVNEPAILDLQIYRR